MDQCRSQIVAHTMIGLLGSALLLGGPRIYVSFVLFFWFFAAVPGVSIAGVWIVLVFLVVVVVAVVVVVVIIVAVVVAVVIVGRTIIVVVPCSQQVIQIFCVVGSCLCPTSHIVS